MADWTEDTSSKEIVQELALSALSNPVMIDDEQILFATHDETTWRCLVYNTRTCQWKSLKDVDMESCIFCIERLIEFDIGKHLIYFVCRNDSGFIIRAYDIKTGKCTELEITISLSSSGNNRGASMKLIRNKLHFLMGSYNDEHFVIDIDKKECKKLHNRAYVICISHYYILHIICFK